MNSLGVAALLWLAPAVLAALPAAGAVPPSPAATGWTDVTTPSLAVYAQSAAWGDVDGDGDPDLAISGYQHRVLRNDGAAGFVPRDSFFYMFPFTTNWSDVDNDGDPDLCLNHFNPGPAVYRNDGGTLTWGTDLWLMGSSKGGHGIASADVDRDGDLDLACGDTFERLTLLRNDGAWTFTRNGELGDARAPQWIDYDGDGLPNLHRVGPGSHVSPGTNPPPPEDFDNASVAAWGDYDNDGDPDLYLAKSSGTNRLMRNDGPAGFADVTASTPLGLAGASTDASWVDYDNDGDLDLFVVHGDSSNILFRNEGAGTFVDAGHSALDGVGVGLGAAWADYDGDGDLDVYIAGYEASDRLIRNDLPGLGHWLHVDLAGVVTNRSGVGSRIRVKAGGRWSMQDVSSGNGHTQGSVTAEFGLGAATIADSLVVEWPDISRTVQTFTNVAADRRILITERQPLAAPDPTARPRTGLLGVAPNPTAGPSRLGFVLASTQSVRLDVVDVTGRSVRSLADRAYPPGRREVAWDGRDQDGAAIPAGIYWVRFAAGPHRDARRLVVLR